MKRMLLFAVVVTMLFSFAIPEVVAEVCKPPWHKEYVGTYYGYHPNDVDIACDRAYDAAWEACDPSGYCFCIVEYQDSGLMFNGMWFYFCEYDLYYCCWYGK
ncbi:hypothetical protein K8T06_04820 [bacterium]|nr:hypothetical protein [bacterium]